MISNSESIEQFTTNLGIAPTGEGTDPSAIVDRSHQFSGPPPQPYRCGITVRQVIASHLKGPVIGTNRIQVFTPESLVQIKHEQSIPHAGPLPRYPATRTIES